MTVETSALMTEPGLATAAVYAKVYRNILPLLCLVAGLCYIDRTNLAYASFSMTRDLHFSPTVYGAGSGLFFAGYSLCMIPSQLIGLRVGVSRWLGIQVAVWGLVASCFSLVKTVGQFYTLRFLLGMAEAGAFPAIWYYLYLMLPKEALVFPYSALEASVSCANVLSAPLAAFLLVLDGKIGMSGWQWLFLLEGFVTMAIGSCAGLLLPASIHQATFLRGPDRRVIQEQQGRTWNPSIGGFAEPGQLTDASLLREALGNWKVWYVSVMAILKNVAANALLFWLPIIVASLIGHDDGGPPSALMANVTATSAVGAPAAASRLLLAGGGISFSGAKPNALSLPVLLSSIPFACNAVFALLLGRSSQATGDRAMHLFFPYLTAGLIFGALSHIRAVSITAAFVALCVALACTIGTNCISNAYIPAIASSSSVSVAMALYNSVGNLGGMLGPWIIGVVVESTGSYDQAIQLLGVFMLVAAAMAWYTRRWEDGHAAKNGAAAGGGALMNNRSVGSEMSSLMPCLRGSRHGEAPAAGGAAAAAGAAGAAAPAGGAPPPRS
ncbi:hypothetical protein FOA52_006143 [Chlamydomonas sp. UWO 241]|nr:hypothetical protein FOA52_006143 [Chlamydomonas sp. UWO 241]